MFFVFSSVPFARSATSLGEAHIIAKHIICAPAQHRFVSACGGMMLAFG
jgi:hypothetical protein